MITKYEEYIKESLSTKADIKNWLDKMYIKNYTINDDLTVDVDGNVDIINKKLTKIPVNFNKVNGDFYCFNNKLTSLEGCPLVVNSDFNCSDNMLKTLKYSPTYIKDRFICHNNILNDITDLDSKILIQSIKFGRDWTHEITKSMYSLYFMKWVDKDIDIISVLDDKISSTTKLHYSHYFNAKNFDIL